ncbi:MAG: 16S rRNA (guanine(527)-N(7))-methyltransferase RsmG [Rhizobiaceae bacterium]
MSEYESLRSVAGDVSRETYERLKTFEATFRKWAGRINLSAPSTLASLWQRHILDSAQLMPLAPKASRWVDIGSGGGFPGAIVATLLQERPGSRIALIESNRKKTAFLQAALGEVGARAEIHSVRIEASHQALSFSPEVVTARALAPLDVLFGLAEPWLSSGARGLFHKGRDYRMEVEQSSHAWNFNLIVHPSRIEPDSVILEITELKRAVGNRRGG